jgi:hypothetical protein
VGPGDLWALQQYLGDAVVLKGGAATQLYLPVELQRTSVDIDIICTATIQEFDRVTEEILSRLSRASKLLRCLTRRFSNWSREKHSAEWIRRSRKMFSMNHFVSELPHHFAKLTHAFTYLRLRGFVERAQPANQYVSHFFFDPSPSCCV